MFSDSGLPDHDAGSARLLRQRLLKFPSEL
jgi:hypothetical protein